MMKFGLRVLPYLLRYKDLYVYQLEHPTQVMEWTSAKSERQTSRLNTSSKQYV